MSYDNLGAINVLARCMAYVSMADGSVDASERAVMVAVLSKWVKPGVMEKEDLAAMAKEAFDTAKTVEIDTYMKMIKGTLTKAQSLSLISNILDLILSDGKLTEGELKALRAICEALEIQDDDFNALRVVFVLKNNVDIYLDPMHRWNEGTYKLPIQARSDSGFER